MSDKKECKERRCILSDIHLEKREDGESGRSITGYAFKFNTWSDTIGGWFREMILPDALVGCDLSDVIATFNHNIDDIMARTSSKTLSLIIDEVGFKFSFEAPHTSRGNDLVELVRRGDINQCSFIMEVEMDEWTYADKENKLEVDERKISKIAKIWDVSPVVYASYQSSEISVRNLEQVKELKIKKKKNETDEIELRGRAFQFITLQNNN